MRTWSDKYLTGIEVVDEQHKELFNIVDKCYDLLLNDTIIDKYDSIMEIIDELKNYTIYHFREEEEIQLKIGYKKFLSHKVMHDTFIDKLNHLDFKVIDEDHNKAINNLVDFARDWIVGHILTVDKDIINNLRNQ